MAVIAPVDARLAFPTYRALHAGLTAVASGGGPLVPSPVPLEGDGAVLYQAVLKRELAVRGRATAGLFM